MVQITPTTVCFRENISILYLDLRGEAHMKPIPNGGLQPAGWAPPNSELSWFVTLLIRLIRVCGDKTTVVDGACKLTWHPIDPH